MLDVVIAECPTCGYQYFAYNEEEAREKYATHKCPNNWTKEELDKKIKMILEGKNEVA